MNANERQLGADVGGTARPGGQGSKIGESGGRFWALALALFVLNAVGLVWIGREVRAGGPDSVRIQRVLPVRSVERASELALVFDRPIAPADVIGITLQDPPFRIEPPLEGRWRWSEDSKLELALTEPLAPGRVFRLLAEPDFEALTGFRLQGESTFELRTAALALQHLELSSTSPTALQLEFTFNQPVAPEDLSAALSVQFLGAVSDAEAPTARVLTPAPGRELLVEVPRTESGEDTLSIVLAAGLHGAGAELGLAEDLKRNVSISAGFAAQSARAWAASSSNTCQVSLSFSEPLALGQELPTVIITPPVEPFSARVSGSSLTLEGDFRCGDDYQVEVGESLLGVSGHTLGRPASFQLRIPARPNSLSFPDGEGQLSPGGRLELALRASNVASLEVSAARLHSGNLVAHLHGGDARETSRALPDKVIDLDLEPDRVTDCLLDLSSILDAPLGVYAVKVRDRDDRWERDRALIRISDLTLTVKQESDGLFVWVTSLRSGAPQPGVQLEARTYNDQVLARALTDFAGRGRLVYPEALPDGEAWVITASLGADFSYLLPERGAWVFDDVDTSGRAYDSELDAWLYTDRGVYRPGETIHLAGILRGVDGSFPPAAAREVVLRQPDGRVAFRAELEGDAALDAQGLFQLDLPTRRDGRTGRHEVELIDRQTQLVLRRLALLVDEFVPSRLEVEVTTSPTELTSAAIEAGAADAGTAIEASAAAGAPEAPPHLVHEVRSRDFLGTPSVGLAVRVVPTWRRIAYRSTRFPELRFGEVQPASERERGSEQRAQLDEAGTARFQLSPPSDALPGLWNAEITSTVTELGGRSTTRSSSERLDTAPRHLGLGFEDEVAPVGVEFDVEWKLLTPDDELAQPSPYEVRLERVQYEYGLSLVNGKRSWQRRERVEDIARHSLGETSEGHLRLHVPAAGDYRVVALDRETGVETSLSFSAGDHRVAGDPERLELSLDRHAYAPGDRVRAEVRGGFAGRLLVTLESDHVLDSRVLEHSGDDTGTALEFTLPADLRGGAFVCASLLRGVDSTETSWLPHRARGLTRVRTDHSSNALPVTLEAPERLRPGDPMHVRIVSDAPTSPGRPTRVHVWAVDAGILLATDEALPDPLAHFFGQRRSSVRTSDGWAEVLPDFTRPESTRRIGGDRELDEAMARRLSRAPEVEREAGVAWTRAVDLGPDGSVELELTAPELRGAVQLRAVLVDGDHYAAAERRVELATPLDIEPSWPLACAPGDRIQVPLEVTNTTDRPLSFSLAPHVSGPLELEAREQLEALTLAAGASRVFWFDARAMGLGSVEVSFSATGDELEERATSTLVVRPAAPLHQHNELLTIEAGSSWDDDPSLGFASDGLRIEVEVSPRPDVELRPALRALLDYPHGCLEQTTSRLFALVHATPLLEAEAGGEASSAPVESMVRAGIGRLQAMQTRSGGLAYWMGGQQPSTWGSAYAASFLVEARRAGYELRPSFTGPLVGYLAKALRDGREDPNTLALITRILAEFGQPQEGWMTRLFERRAELDMAGRAHLAAGWLRIGRRDRAEETLGEDTLSLAVRSSDRGRFTSDVRQRGVLLSTLLDLDPAHPWAEGVARRLLESRENGRWRSTLEDAAALAALARFQGLTVEAGDYRGVLVDAAGGRHEFDSRARTRMVLEGPAAVGPLHLEVEGEVPAHALVSVEGLPIATVPAYDRNLSVRRRWLDREGREVSELQVGDLVRVEVELSAPGLPNREKIANVAVMDLLPAGLEVENPRLASSAQDPLLSSARADHVEFREDRVVLFASAAAKPAVFRYLLRATAAGSFVAPPIQASSMYDPGIASLGEFGELRITEAAARR